MTSNQYYDYLADVNRTEALNTYNLKVAELNAQKAALPYMFFSNMFGAISSTTSDIFGKWIQYKGQQEEMALRKTELAANIKAQDAKLRLLKEEADDKHADAMMRRMQEVYDWKKKTREDAAMRTFGPIISDLSAAGTSNDPVQWAKARDVFNQQKLYLESNGIRMTPEQSLMYNQLLSTKGQSKLSSAVDQYGLGWTWDDTLNKASSLSDPDRFEARRLLEVASPTEFQAWSANHPLSVEDQALYQAHVANPQALVTKIMARNALPQVIRGMLNSIDKPEQLPSALAAKRAIEDMASGGTSIDATTKNVTNANAFIQGMPVSGMVIDESKEVKPSIQDSFLGSFISKEAEMLGKAVPLQPSIWGAQKAMQAIDKRRASKAITDTKKLFGDFAASIRAGSPDQTLRSTLIRRIADINRYYGGPGRRLTANMFVDDALLSSMGIYGFTLQDQVARMDIEMSALIPGAQYVTDANGNRFIATIEPSTSSAVVP